jgi:hypothetical protein
MRCIRVLLLVLGSTAALAMAQAAQAATFAKVGTELHYTVGAGDTVNSLSLEFCENGPCGGDRIIMTENVDSVTYDASAGCSSMGTVPPGTLVGCPVAGITQLKVSLGGGGDTLAIDSPSNFGVLPWTIPVNASGGDGNDTLNGGSGPDVLDGGFGSDTIRGHGGNDVASYASRGDGVTVNLGTAGADDGSANDGASGSRDNINPTDVEGVFGSNGDDALTGRGGADTLNGMDGADVLDGGSGGDVIDGGAGSADKVSYAGRLAGVTVNLSAPGADDGSGEDGPAGSRDTVSNTEGIIGGEGGDNLDGSTLGLPLTIEGRGGGDRLRGGNASSTLRGEGGNDDLAGGADPDLLEGGDGNDTIDGLAGGDTVRAGSGFDTVEARDGIADDVDCGPDDDAAFTDPVDTRTNCDPVPAGAGTTTTSTPSSTALQRLLVTPAFRSSPGRRSTLLRSLVVKSVDAGSRLTVKCRTRRGSRCPRTTDFSKRNARGNVRVRSFEGKRLPIGAKLEIRVTNAGMIGAVKILTVRKRKNPSVTTLCLQPGATKAGAC